MSSDQNKNENPIVSEEQQVQLVDDNQNSNENNTIKINVPERINHYFKSLGDMINTVTDSIKNITNGLMSSYINPTMQTVQDTTTKVKDTITAIPSKVDGVRKTVHDIEKNKEDLGLIPHEPKITPQQGGKSKRRKLNKKKATIKKYNKK
jgi:hypothetical protein